MSKLIIVLLIMLYLAIGFVFNGWVKEEWQKPDPITCIFWCPLIFAYFIMRLIGFLLSIGEHIRKGE